MLHNGLSCMDAGVTLMVGSIGKSFTPTKGDDMALNDMEQEVARLTLEQLRQELADVDYMSKTRVLLDILERMLADDSN